MNGWKTNALYWQPAGLYERWYWLQEITTTTATQTLIRLPTNDGLAVYLNGQEVFVINNPTRDTSLESTILLPLESGSNKLLVKYFNRFNKGIKMGIFTNIPQILYKKALPEMVFEKDRTYQLDLQLPPQYRIHQNMDAPNCSIELKYN